MDQEKETQNSGKINSGLKYSRLLIIILIILPSLSQAQKWEIGGGAGGGNYQGDVSPTFRFENVQPAGGIFGRYNFSQVVSVKLGLNLIKTHGSTAWYNDPYRVTNPESFIRVVGELTGQVEYNFFNYRNEKSRRNWTPYYFLGAGLMYMHGNEPTNPASAIQPVIPTGIGLRYILGGKWNLGLEVGVRKTFTDYFDHRGYSETPIPGFNGNKYDRDWYFNSAISISYTFYTIPCPFSFD